MLPIVKGFFRLLESYLFVLLVACVAGLLFPSVVSGWSSYGQLFLSIIFFLSTLKMDLSRFRDVAKDPWMLLISSAFMLIVFPIVIFQITQAISPSLAIPFMLLAAMPTGMTAPLLSDVVGGRTDLALVITMITSLFAPFTIPFIVQLLAGSAVTVGFWTMAWSLMKVMIIPMALAMIVRHFFKKAVSVSMFTFKPASLLLLAALIAGIIGQQIGAVREIASGKFTMTIIALFLLFAAFHFIGYAVTPWRSIPERLTVSICLTYMNFTLAIFLAGQFFHDAHISIVVILSMLPWTLMVIPFRLVAKRLQPSPAKS
ncbi:MAG: hypothetical protein KIH65_002875 [Candidatus Uhrbacteria bacterium]|nr:hypothetical protein [Candidatus Uhrbacteria bacterium]